jgi:protease IV
MPLETDLLIDRRRLKRRLVVWRTLAVLALIGAALVVWRGQAGVLGGPRVARLTVSGIITQNRKLDDQVARLAGDNRVKALIVEIDSPGGSVSGGESLHDAIAQVAAKKPVVVVMDGIAASAGYMIAVPASRIFAQEGTLTGSIGVLLPTGDVSGLLKTLGISMDDIVSGPLKDQPSYTKPLTPEGRAVLQGIVMDMYDQFVEMVAAGRHMDPDKVRQLGDGRAYTGRQALKLGLVDAIGGEHAARAWLATERSIPTSLPVDEVSVDGLAARMFAGSLSGLFGMAWKSVFSQGVMLDGAWAIWQRPGD